MGCFIFITFKCHFYNAILLLLIYLVFQSIFGESHWKYLFQFHINTIFNIIHTHIYVSVCICGLYLCCVIILCPWVFCLHHVHYMCVGVPCVCLVPAEARSRQIESLKVKVKLREDGFELPCGLGELNQVLWKGS